MTFHPHAMEVFSPVEPHRISTPAPGDSPGTKGVVAAGQIPAAHPAGHLVTGHLVTGHLVTGHLAVLTDRWGR